MKNIFLNILAVIAGAVIGSVVNMGILQIQDSIIPLPEGFDMKNFGESIKLLETQHFIMPFLAHGLGALVGACIAALISPNSKFRVALIIGVLFLAGGISTIVMYGGPLWFTFVDLIFAYLPMAWIGYKLALYLSEKLKVKS